MRKNLIEVALPLGAINAASVQEKSIRHRHPCVHYNFAELLSRVEGPR